MKIRMRVDLNGSFWNPDKNYSMYENLLLFKNGISREQRNGTSKLGIKGEFVMKVRMKINSSDGYINFYLNYSEKNYKV